jgi:hypothetical protein
MRYLWFVSCCVLLASCTSRFAFDKYPESKKKANNKTINLFWKSDSTTKASIKFLANTTIYGKEIKGILILRKMSDTLYKATFLAQGAAKLFDMEILPDTFITHYSIEQLNKQAVLRTLANDIRLITIECHKTLLVQEIRNSSKDEIVQIQFKGGFRYHFQDSESNLKQVIQTNFQNKKDLTATFSNYKNGKPHNILLKHHRFRMQIDLSLMLD